MGFDSSTKSNSGDEKDATFGLCRRFRLLRDDSCPGEVLLAIFRELEGIVGGGESTSQSEDHDEGSLQRVSGIRFDFPDPER